MQINSRDRRSPFLRVAASSNFRCSGRLSAPLTMTLGRTNGAAVTSVALGYAISVPHLDDALPAAGLSIGVLSFCS